MTTMSSTCILSPAVLYNVVYLLYCMLMTTSGSVIQFGSSPQAIMPLLSPHLMMRCSLNDTTSGPVVGRDVTSTTDDVPHVTSIVITRGKGDTVGSVTQFSPARPYVDQDTLQVTGDVSGNPGERAFLQLLWKTPTEEQVGPYKCEITGVTDDGHSVVFTTDATVTTVTPTIGDLVHYIHSLTVENENLITTIGDLNGTLNSKINSLQTENTNLNSKVADLESRLQTEVQTVQSLSATTQNYMQQTSASILRLDHIEHGTVDCEKSESATVTFSTPYGNDPIVHVSFRRLDIYMIDDSKTNPDVYFAVSHVTKTGFQVDCGYYSTHVDNSHLYMYWTSFPN